MRTGETGVRASGRRTVTHSLCGQREQRDRDRERETEGRQVCVRTRVARSSLRSLMQRETREKKKKSTETSDEEHFNCWRVLSGVLNSNGRSRSLSPLLFSLSLSLTRTRTRAHMCFYVPHVSSRLLMQSLLPLNVSVCTSRRTLLRPHTHTYA